MNGSAWSPDVMVAACTQDGRRCIVGGKTMKLTHLAKHPSR